MLKPDTYAEVLEMVYDGTAPIMEKLNMVKCLNRAKSPEVKDLEAKQIILDVRARANYWLTHNQDGTINK